MLTPEELYEQLRIVAKFLVKNERLSIGESTLAHEMWVRKIASALDREHPSMGFALLCHWGRQTLVEIVRHNHAQKRDIRRVVSGVGLDSLYAPDLLKSADIEALDDAMSALRTADPEEWCMVSLRYWGDLDIDEIAELSKVSRATVERGLKHGTSWLKSRLTADQEQA